FGALLVGARGVRAQVRAGPGGSGQGQIARAPQTESQRTYSGARRRRENFLGVDGDQPVSRGQVWQGAVVARVARGPRPRGTVEFLGDDRDRATSLNDLAQPDAAAARAAQRAGGGGSGRGDARAAEGARRGAQGPRTSDRQGLHDRRLERLVSPEL